ncbi:MAG: permease-like cell division protein FtsX [Bacilli bacterium]|nr:permease-like cell division protein FtsX [Bacilli bacterium]
MKAIRILGRSIRDSFKSVFRNFSLSIASIACTTITLILVSVALIVSYNINNVTKKLESELSIIVYLNKETTIEDVDALELQIKNIPNVNSVTYKSKDEWKLEMQSYSDTLDTTLEYLGSNPLLDSFVVTVNDVNDFKITADTIRGYDHVESADYGAGMVDQLVTIFDLVEKATFILVIALILVTAFLISNTIKLTIFSRRNEIEIMRLVGTSNTTIKLPFLFEGFVLGILGSIIPIIITIYGYIIVYDRLDGYLFSQMIELVEPLNFVFYVALILLVIGSVVGMFASFRAVKKYLKI